MVDKNHRDKKRVADAVLEKQKDKAIGQVFDQRFSWDEMIDATADVYLGVRVFTSPSSVSS